MNKILGYTIIGLVAITIFLSIRGRVLVKQRDTARESAKNISNLLTIERTNIVTYRNRLGTVVNRTQRLELSLRNVQDLKDTERLKFLAQFEKLKANLKNLQSAGTFEFELERDSLPFSTVYVPCADSLKTFLYEYKDEYNHIKAQVLDTPTFEISVPINYVEYWDRRWFLGRKTYYIESTSPNKLIRLVAQEKFEITGGKRRR